MPAHALITGATGGIGLALARRLAGEGATLTLVGRRALGELADPIFVERSYCQADLRMPDAGCRRANRRLPHGPGDRAA